MVIVSHLGRPDGKRKEKESLAPVAEELEKRLGRKVVFVKECVGKEVEKVLAESEQGAVILLENLRFHIEEEGSVTMKVNGKKQKVKCDPAKQKEFRKALTRLGDVFVNDAFGTMHRAHSSMVGIETPIRAAGLLVEKELKYFAQALENPKKPFAAVLGGAKVADKIKLIRNLLSKVDELVIGGGMAFTFLKVLGVKIGKSIFDEEGSQLVENILKEAKEKGVKIYLPIDFVCAAKITDTNVVVADDKTGVPDNLAAFDIGPKSAALFAKVISGAKTVVLNGPMGVFEKPQFAHATKVVLDALVEATANGAITIVGGGDSASAAEQFGAAKKLSHISTGGGASLELLEGKVLPGVKALTDIKLRAKL